MRKLFKKILNIYYLAVCGGIVGTHCLEVIVRHYLRRLTHADMDRIVRHAAAGVLKVTKTKYTIYSKQNLKFDEQQPYIFMSNHQSLIDIPLIYISIPGTLRFIVKKELLKVPLFGKMLELSESVPIDRSKPAYLTDFFQQIKSKFAKNISFWIFTEGTRSKTGELLPFKNGGFRLAREISAKIIPVGIINTRGVLPAGTLSLNLNQSTQIRIGEPIDAKDYANPESHSLLVERVRQAIIELMVPVNPA